MFVGGLVGWPLAAATVARNEPQFVLGLSFLAIIIEGFNGIQIASDKRSEQERDDGLGNLITEVHVLGLAIGAVESKLDVQARQIQALTMGDARG